MDLRMENHHIQARNPLKRWRSLESSSSNTALHSKMDCSPPYANMARGTITYKVVAQQPQQAGAMPQQSAAEHPAARGTQCDGAVAGQPSSCRKLQLLRMLAILRARRQRRMLAAVQQRLQGPCTPSATCCTSAPAAADWLRQLIPSTVLEAETQIASGVHHMSRATTLLITGAQPALADQALAAAEAALAGAIDCLTRAKAAALQQLQQRRLSALQAVAAAQETDEELQDTSDSNYTHASSC